MGVIDVCKEGIEANSAGDRLWGTSGTSTTTHHDRDLDPAQMANRGFITIHTLDFEFTKAMQWGGEGNEVMEGACAAEVFRADDADAAARVSESCTKADGGIEDGAVGIGLEYGSCRLETAGIAQDAGGAGRGSRGSWCILESEVAPTEDFVDSASDAVRLGVEGGALLQAAGGGEAVADIVHTFWVRRVGVLTTVALGGPEVGDCIISDAVGRLGGWVVDSQGDAGGQRRGGVREAYGAETPVIRGA